MKQEKKRKLFRGKYDGFTLFLVPGLTLCLASLENWFGTNLSVVCSTGGLRLGFALWGILSGIYYMRYTFYLFRLGNYREGAGRGLVFTAGGFLIAAVLIPYEPDLKPQAAILHVALAFLARSRAFSRCADLVSSFYQPLQQEAVSKSLADHVVFGGRCAGRVFDGRFYQQLSGAVCGDGVVWLFKVFGASAQEGDFSITKLVRRIPFRSTCCSRFTW